MESGTVNITGAQDDGIQVELSNDPATAVISDHEDENTGNFYMEGGTLTISGYTGKAVKADGTISATGGTRNYSSSDTEELAAIDGVQADGAAPVVVSDLGGRRTAAARTKGIYVVRRGDKLQKMVIR